MQYLFLLNKSNPKIAISEIEALIGTRPDYSDDEVCCISLAALDLKIASRLAYVKKVCRVLFSEKSALRFDKSFSGFDWKSVFKNNYRVRVLYLEDVNRVVSLREKDLGSVMWRSLAAAGAKPCVDLENPTTRIEIVVHGKRIYCCLEIFDNKERFEGRRAHKRPVLHPSSLHPQLARAMVNLTGVRRTDARGIQDPFCGTGGILIEAGLMGIPFAGSDIDNGMVEACRRNLEFYKLNGKLIGRGDALKIRLQGVIVTDMPYARNTRVENFPQLYLSFFQRLAKHLKKGERAVVGLPDFIDEKPLLKKAKLRCAKRFDYYLHRSLSKKIIVVSIV